MTKDVLSLGELEMVQEDRTQFDSEIYLEGNPFTLLGQVQSAAGPNLGAN